MTPKEYLAKILNQESLGNDSPEIQAIWEEREIVEKILLEHFDESKPTIRYGGSKAKGTMIRSHYDLDIVCYFDRDDTTAGETLEEIFNNVKEALGSQYMVVPKTSALRLQGKSGNMKGVYFHIDVVPGRFIEENSDDVFLHQTTGDKARLKTNLEKHIAHIKNSGLQPVIKLAKLWKKRNGLQIRTFVLELIVIEVLKNSKTKDDLESCLTALWKKLAEDIDSIQVVDPANPDGNDLSKLFDATTKLMVSSAAANAINFVSNNQWESILGPVEKLTNAETIAAVNIIRANNPTAPRLYSHD